MKTVAIIQARMGSTRLPGKIMKRLMDRTVLAHVVNRVSAVQGIDEIVIATTRSNQDDQVMIESRALDVPYYRGSEQNVLERYYECAKMHGADTVIRITSDCPLIEPTVVENVLRTYLSTRADYASNCLERSYPRGLDCEVFTMNALTTAYEYADQDFYKEHVTPFLYQHPDRFQLTSVKNEVNYSQHRWTLDTPEDWELIRQIYEELYRDDKRFTWLDVLELLDRKPELFKLNAHIEQKKLV